MKRLAPLPAALVAVLLLAAPVRADTALEEAKALTNRATIEYNVGKFSQALDLYSKAYEKYPIPVLLFDIGQCHRLLKNYDRALFFLRGYLRAEPSAPNRGTVEELIAEAQKEVDDQHALEAARAQLAVPPPARATPQPSGAEAHSPAGESDSGAAAGPSGSGAVQGVGMATTALGLAAIGVGTYLGLRANTLANDVSSVSSSAGKWTQADQVNYENGRSSAVAANVLFAAGGVAIAAGVVMTYFGWPRGAPASVTATVAPAPVGQGAQLALVGRF